MKRFYGRRVKQPHVWTALATCALFFTHAPGAMAAGNCDSGGTTTSLPSIKVAADAPIGSVVWTGTVNFSAGCAGGVSGDTIYLYNNNLNALSSYGLTFEVTYNGQKLGYKIAIGTLGWFEWRAFTGSYTLQLRKTGTTPTSGNVSLSSSRAIIYTGSDISQPNAADIYSSLNNISFVNYTCSVDTASRSITVPLGDVREDKFTGLGSTSPDRKFDIRVACSQPAGTYDAMLTFNATADSSKAPGVIALTSDASAAGGVGIQLLANGQPVSFGTEQTVGNATTATTYTIPMTARYYQTTAARVKPGKANGIATFVLTYK
jgi:major type 1 subunit fimbrin (pilin)